ncbi:MAG TPA: hypothetical protein VNU95_01840 [Candidatus Acidoferrales bacterium]|jgi:hypothetical protein|nr:hypothetical protein [Candidatus Acidoferrales bacterium]
MTRAADQVEWNFKQFRRRVKRWVKLPNANTEEDIRAVARAVFEKAPEAAIKKIVGYALLSKRDVSAVGDVAAELRVMAGTENLTDVSTEQVHQAIYDFLLPSDRAFMEGMEASRVRSKKSRKLVSPLPEISDPEAGDETPGVDCQPTRRTEPFQAPSRRNGPVLTAH